MWDWLPELLSAFGAGFVTWFFSRKKQRAEVETNELNNVEQAIKIWRDMSQNLEAEVTELRSEVVSLRKSEAQLILKVQKLVAELEDTNKNFKKALKENEELKKKLA